MPVPDLLGNTQIQNLTHLVEPWSTGIQISENRPIRPWEPTHEKIEVRLEKIASLNFGNILGPTI